MPSEGPNAVDVTTTDTIDVTEKLFETAASLRRLVNLFTDRELDPDLLDEITTIADEMADRIELLPQWDRQAMLEASLAGLNKDDGRRKGFPHRAISGPANPTATPMVLHFGDDIVTTEITFETMNGGAPGRGHGGMLAAFFDDFAGAAPRLLGLMAATARLTVRYRSPIPIGEPLELRAWVDSHQGRKINVRGDARRGDEVIADLEALYIAIDYNAIDTSGEARH